MLLHAMQGAYRTVCDPSIPTGRESAFAKRASKGTMHVVLYLHLVVYRNLHICEMFNRRDFEDRWDMHQPPLRIEPGQSTVNDIAAHLLTITPQASAANLLYSCSQHLIEFPTPVLHLQRKASHRLLQGKFGQQVEKWHVNPA